MSESPTGCRSSWIEIGVAVFVVLLLAAYLLPALEQSREASRRSQSRNQFKQLGIALHNYHESFECFPPGGTFAADGTPHHSWTLFIEPYLACSPFYNSIDPNRPWDDPVNRDKFQKAVWSLHDPSVPRSKTAAGYETITSAPNQRLLFRNSSTRLKSIPHQAATLLMADPFGAFASFGNPINWRDATLPFRTSPRGFGHIAPERSDGTHVLFVDGSVAFVSNAIDPDRSRQLAGIDIPEPPSALTAQRETTTPAATPQP